MNNTHHLSKCTKALAPHSKHKYKLNTLNIRNHDWKSYNDLEIRLQVKDNDSTSNGNGVFDFLPSPGPKDGFSEYFLWVVLSSSIQALPLSRDWLVYINTQQMVQ